MKTNKILKDIRESGGFDNFRNWNKKEIAKWVECNYECSTYVATNVAFYLI